MFRPATVPKSSLAIYCSIIVSDSILLLHVKSSSLVRVIPLSLEIVTAIGAVTVIACMPLRDPDLPTDQICTILDVPNLQLRTPEDNLKLWQFMTVSWMNPLISLGRKRQLDDIDVWSLGFEFQHKGLHNAFRELHGTVVRRLLKANGLDLIITGCLGILELSASMMSDEKQCCSIGI